MFSSFWRFRPAGGLASGLAFGRFGAGSVRIRDRELTQNPAFCSFHRLGILVPLMVIADEMQEPVHREMGEMVRKRLFLGARFARDGLEGENDVAKVPTMGVRARERQDIRGRIDVPPVPVEQAYGRIISEHDSKLRPAC